MPHALGIDIGSVAVKLALVGPDGKLLGVWSRPIVRLPAEALASLIAEVSAETGWKPILGQGEIPISAEATTVRIGVTGDGCELVRGPVRRETGVVALTRALPVLFPDAQTAIEVGGHSARYVVIEPRTRTLLDYGLNQQCAAGSGSFFEQQARRLGLSVEAFAQLSAGAPRGATVAGRCSVFAKSDMIHLQQKGTPVGEIAYGLCLAMARNFLATVIRGRQVVPPLAIVGGGAANQGLVRAFAEVLGLDAESIRISPNPGGEGAVGAAFAALDCDTIAAVPWADVMSTLAIADPKRRGSTLMPLAVEPSPAAPLDPLPAEGPVDAYLGVDVGSVSTNLVLLSPDGKVYEGIYLPTRGRPIETIGQGLDSIRDSVGERLHVLGVAVTGSGRYLAAHLLGADLVKNEITCQLRAAVEIAPDVDTIFEIGGQDSKYIHVRDGHSDDFVMNKICAAGTGSFLEEQAEHLGVAIVDEFSRLAAASTAPSDLGCQCTVFMHSEVVAAQRRGVSAPDLCAGLAYSVARNYLERVVAARPIGRSVMFQGGVASNSSVVAAFRQILGTPVRVHPYAKVSGAIGAALLVRGTRQTATSFRGFDACHDQEVESFECQACANRCQVNQVLIERHKVYFGDACERYSSRVVGHPSKNLPDLVARWREIEQPYLAPPPEPRGRIGIPRASTLVDQLPFWGTFFARLGYEIVPSQPSSQATLQAGQRRLPAETCLPIKLAFGHVKELVEAGVNHIFLPSILTRAGDDARFSHSCPYVQAVPYMIMAALSASFLTPEVHLSHGEDAFVAGLTPALSGLGVGRHEIAEAYRKASAAWAEFRRRIVDAGREVLNGVDRAMIVIGKPYNVLDPYLNLNLLKHLRHLGVTAIPMWYLPIEDVELEGPADQLPWHMNRMMVRAVRYCQRDDRLFPILVSNFGCGPDAFTQMLLAPMLDGRPSLVLEFDEHRAEAGLITRLEAFLDEIEEPHTEPVPHAAVEPNGQARAPCTDGRGRPDLPSRAVVSGPKTVHQSFVIPYFSDHAYAYSGALRAAGHRARVLPLPSEEIRLLGQASTSGKECHPYSLLTGDLVHLARSPREGNEVFFFFGTTIPCLLHQYGEGHRQLLKRMKVSNLSVMTPLIDDLRALVGLEIGARLWRGLVAVDLLIRMVCETRPYELERGQTDEVHRQNIKDIETAIATDELSAALTMAISRLRLIAVDRSKPRPVVGVAGDIYTRINPVGNQDLFLWLEEQGCEVWPAPFIVDITDFSFRRDWTKGTLGEAALLGAIMLRKNVESWRVRRMFRGQVKHGDEPGYQEVLDMATPYLGEQQNEVLVLNVAKMVDFARRGADGIVNAVCFNCMLGTVSSAVTGRIREDHDGIPIVNLVYSAVEGSQTAMLEAFLHQVKTYTKRRSDAALAAGASTPPRDKGLLARLWLGG
ncbi:MAG: acyl-CoA dehydratase activase [Thermoguttaceae bacterium]|jgi:predicted CoA-substrate-specific enzyme activase